LDHRGIIRLYGRLSDLLRRKLQSLSGYPNTNLDPYEHGHKNANLDRDTNPHANIHHYRDSDGNRHPIHPDDRNTDRNPNADSHINTNGHRFSDDSALYAHLRANGSAHPNSGDVIGKASSLD
jgi:hypothetical protein